MVPGPFCRVWGWGFTAGAVPTMEHQLYLGINVGKTAHHATDLSAEGTVCTRNFFRNLILRSGRCFKT